jgi:CheY-like chemotaxis protein
MAAILIIESRDVVRALFRELLGRAGHDVWEASQGLEGIHQYRLVPTDLVVTDVHMPDCDDLEVIVTLRNEYPTLKILAVSAHSGKGDVLMTAKLLGADATVQDALDGEALLAAVEHLLGRV